MAGKDAGSAALRWETGTSRQAMVGRPWLWLAAAALVGFILSQAALGAPAERPAASRAAAGPQPASAAPAQPAPLPVVAVVNGEQIQRQTLQQECLRRYGKEVLDSVISKQIIMQACQARGITITAKDVEDEIYHVANKFGLSIDRWLTLLETERDVDPQQYRRDIIWPTLALRRIAAKQMDVTPDEFRQAFESEYGPRVNARLIAVSSRAKAEQLLAKARAAPDKFPQLAKENSEDKASASAYGIIPPIRKHLGDANLEQVAFGLKEGEISPIVQVGNMHVLLKCEKQLSRTYISSQNLPEIEKQLTERIREHKMRVQTAEVFQGLQKQTKIVNVYNDQKLQQQYPGVAAIINGSQLTVLQLSEECLDRHGRSVLEGEINRKLLVQELRRRNKTVEEQDIDREVVRAAEAYGYVKNGKPDVDAWLKAVTEQDGTTVDLYVRDAVWPSVALKKLVGENVQVTEEDLKKGFESNFGERVEVLAIVLNSHRQAQTVWDMARQNPTERFFGELAQQYSIEPTSRENAGKVPPIRKHSGQPLVEKEAFQLKPGELSGIVAVGDKYVVMRCLGRTTPVVKEFNLVKDELFKDIHEKKVRVAMAKEFDRLKETGQVDNFLAGTSQSGKRPAAATSTASPASYNQPAAPRPNRTLVGRPQPGAVRR
jgi:parvulin-like peptidyl-prolyl isomerase